MNKPDHLVVDDRPFAAGLIFGGGAVLFVCIGVTMLIDLEVSGLVMLAIGGLISLGFYFLVEHSQMVFNRPEGWAELRKKSMHRQSSERYNLDEIEQAVVQSRGSSGSSGAGRTLYRISLFGSGPVAEGIPLTNSYSGGTSAESIALVINAWLAGK